MKRAALILLTLLSFPCGLLATATIVRSGETVTSTVTITGAGDEAIVEEGGAITPAASGSIGIDMSTNTNQSALNQGIITTAGDDAFGIFNSAVGNTITNSGTISTAGNSARGIQNEGDNSTITNSGTISTVEVASYGIYNKITTGTTRQSFTCDKDKGICKHILFTALHPSFEF